MVFPFPFLVLHLYFDSQVEDLKELKELKSLERLAILDLEGNPLCEEEDYRHYALYHLPRIKILDGHCVDATEQAVARNKYAGRLTREMIKEKAQCETLEEIKNLDLSNLRIRCGCMRLPTLFWEQSEIESRYSPPCFF